MPQGSRTFARLVTLVFPYMHCGTAGDHGDYTASLDSTVLTGHLLKSATRVHRAGCTVGDADLECACRGWLPFVLCEEAGRLSTELPNREVLEASDWGVGARL